MIRIKVDFDNKNDQTIPNALSQKLEKILDNYDVTITQDSQDMRQLKNYLDTSNSLMRKDVIDFIKLKAKIDGGELRKITTFINNNMQGGHLL